MESIIKDLREYAEVIADTADDLENMVDNDDIATAVLRLENAIYYLKEDLFSLRNMEEE